MSTCRPSERSPDEAVLLELLPKSSSSSLLPQPRGGDGDGGGGGGGDQSSHQLPVVVGGGGDGFGGGGGDGDAAVEQDVVAHIFQPERTLELSDVQVNLFA